MKAGAPRQAVDWEELRRRLARLGAALSGAEETPERATAVLAARAEALARRRVATLASATEPFLAFGLAEETYAIAANRLLGVFRLHDLAPLPGAPATVAGLTTWRGELLVVLDLREVLGVAGGGLDDRAWVLAVGEPGSPVGLLAGAVRGVEDVDLGEVQPARPAPAGAAHLVVGVTRNATQLLDTVVLLRRELQGGG